MLALQSDLGPRVLDWNWISNNLSDEIVPAFIGHVYLSFVSVAIALVHNQATLSGMYRCS
jgi:osmoprotectant transport system permease protein